MSTRDCWGGGGGGGGRQFPVGRRRHAPVADAGCGCRPRRPRLLSLPSFLKPCQPGKAAPEIGSSSRDSSSSTASFSSCSGATNSTGDSSAYSSDYYSSSHVYGATGAKQQEPLPKATKAASPAPAAAKKKPKQKRCGKMAAAAEEEGVGVALEKESSDPRADFRESMVQMVVEMGLCDWDGLRGMLRRLLYLNAPRHHAAILTAFAEVCAQLVAATTAAAHPQPPPSPPAAAYQYGR